VAEHRTRKEKQSPHYNFLYSWQPSQARVNRESKIAIDDKILKPSASKKAEIQAKDASQARIKKDIFKSLALVSFILIIEVVVYLARNRFGIN
jgi:hypothetical protein